MLQLCWAASVIDVRGAVILSGFFCVSVVSFLGTCLLYCTLLIS